MYLKTVFTQERRTAASVIRHLLHQVIGKSMNTHTEERSLTSAAFEACTYTQEISHINVAFAIKLLLIYIAWILMNAHTHMCSF